MPWRGGWFWQRLSSYSMLFRLLIVEIFGSVLGLCARNVPALLVFFLIIIFIEPQNLSLQRKSTQQLVRKKCCVPRRPPTKLDTGTMPAHTCVFRVLPSLCVWILCQTCSLHVVYSSLSTSWQSCLTDKRILPQTYFSFMDYVFCCYIWEFAIRTGPNDFLIVSSRSFFVCLFCFAL